MKDFKLYIKRNNLIQYLPYLLFFIGSLVRVLQLGIVPGGINQDEAFSGYEAYSLLNYGIDSSGYHNPVYLVTWGSGMSALNSYLMIPFIKIFGLHTWAIRIPAALVAIFSLIVLYKLLLKVFNEKIACIGLFLLVINPWHIMLSRWAMDANLAPGFLLFGLYFFVLGVEKPKYYIFSAIAYGLSLYCYATIWTIVPIILFLQLAYLLYSKKLKFSIELLIAGCILGILATPLLFFVLINTGHMEEIKTGFLSIPKLVYMRNGEVSLKDIPTKFYNLYNIIAKQNDGLPWNTTEEFGLYYKFSLPLIMLGAFYLCRSVFISFKKKEFNMEIFLLIQLLCAILLGVLISVNVNRINCLHISMIICLTLGVYYLSEITKKELTHAVILIYFVSFLGFQAFYYTSYKDTIATYFQPGLDEAVTCAMKKEGTIYVDSNICYTKILFYSGQSTKDYVDTVQYNNYPSSFLSVKSFGRFNFQINTKNADSNGIYLINSSNASAYQNAGCTIKTFDNFAVAYYNQK